MNIRNLIKEVKISLISIFLICTSSFNYYACNYVEEIKAGLAAANKIETEMYVLLDKIGTVDPLHFAGSLNKNLAKKFTSLLDYENVAQNNLEILRNNMGDELFGTLLSTDNIGARLRKFIGYEPDKPRTLGEIELRYKIVLERCGIPLEGFIREYQAQVLESKRLGDGKAEVEKRKTEMEENINQKYLAAFSDITLGEQGKTILSRLDEAQNNIFMTLGALDIYISKHLRDKLR